MTEPDSSLTSSDDQTKIPGLPENPRTLLLLILAVSVVAIVAFSAAYMLMFGYFPIKDRAAWAQFGDYFGGILGPIISLFALIALVLTIALQYRQLAYSRRALEDSSKELELTRQELRRSAEAHAASAEAGERLARTAAQSAYIVLISEAHKIADRFEQQYNSNPTMRDQWGIRRQNLGERIMDEVRKIELGDEV